MAIQRLAFVLALLAPMLAGSGCVSRPSVLGPGVPPRKRRIVTYAGVLYIEGSGFGNDPLDADLFYLELRCPAASTTIPAGDDRISVWRDDLVGVQRLDRELRPGCVVTVYAKGLPVKGAEGIVVEEVRERISHSLPISITNWRAFPLSIGWSDTGGRAYLNAEFHDSIYSLDPRKVPRSRTAPVGRARSHPMTFALPCLGAACTTERIQVPQYVADGGIFRSPRGSHTRKSALGEKVLVEPDTGVIWFSEGGQHLYSGTELNASRIIRYDPVEKEFRCWNIPYNNAQVMGLYWEASSTRGPRMWAALPSYGGEGAIISFRPNTFSATQTPCDHDFARFDDDAAYPARGCKRGHEVGCFTVYALPSNLAARGGRLRPAHLMMDSAGDIWTTLFFGGGIARLKPATDKWAFYPFPAARGLSAQAGTFGGGPWDILLDSTGEFLFVTEFFDAQILRFDMARADKVDCTTLDAAGENPCVTEYSAPVDTTLEFIHSLVENDPGTFYFTVSTGLATEGNGRIGRLEVRGEEAEVLLFPPLASLGVSTKKDDAAGIALDPQTGNLFVANPHGRSIDVFSLVPTE